MFDNKLGIALLIAILLFVGYLLVRAYTPNLFGNDAFMNKNPIAQAEIPGPPPPVEQQPRVEPALVSTPSGPNPPNAMPTSRVETPPPEIRAHDPYDDPNSSSNLQDNLRQPQRMFTPGTIPEDTQMSVMSGVASSTMQTSAQALQTFAPEMAMNGGEFMRGIAANDTGSDMNFAAF